MDIYENEYQPGAVKKSPYADSPYECVRGNLSPAYDNVPKNRKAKRGIHPVFAFLLVVVCCVGTAMGVTGIWQGRFDRMETAMEEKFDALAQLYAEKQNSNSADKTPSQLPVSVSKVYEKNVQAVVAVSCYEGSFGSGFFISSDGYVVTNYHVIAGTKQANVITHDQQTLKAKIVGYDAENDVALLKVEGEAFPCVTIGSSDKLAVGDQVAAIGNPLGELTATLTVGYISAKDRIVNTDGTVINMLQTDAAINSGNSGGPLMNMLGEVVGITTAKYTGESETGATIEGLGFAIPMDDVKDIISDLKEFGYVTGAYLGVYVRDVDTSAQSYGLPAGAYVEEATKGLAAERGGIRAGDIIINLGGYDVDSVTTLTRVLRRFEPGETISVTVYRNGAKEYLSVTLDEKPVASQQTPSENTPGNSGNDTYDWWYDFVFPFFGNGQSDID